MAERGPVNCPFSVGNAIIAIWVWDEWKGIAAMRGFRLFFSVALIGAVVLGAGGELAWGALSAEDVFPADVDPLMGDYVGRWTSEEFIDPALAAQVIALGRDRYRVKLMTKLDMRCPVLLSVEVTRSGKGLSFEKKPYSGKIRRGVFTGGRGKGIFELKKVTRLSPTLGAKPPAGAVVLFDGSGLDAWESPVGWEVTDDGLMMVTPKGQTLASKGRFLDIQLHVEFRTPFMPRSRGQQRGNSGIFCQENYEVQILDSYGLEGDYTECGALYKLSAPHVNACAPPLQWQTYDITYRAPRFDPSGKKLHNGRMTVYHNGVLIHNDQELKWLTMYTEAQRLAPAPSEAEPILLQGHSNYVQYRNLWLEELGE